MRYAIHWRQGTGPFKSSSTVVTCDGIVVWATPVLRHAVGWTFEHLRDHLAERARRLIPIGVDCHPGPLPPPAPPAKGPGDYAGPLFPAGPFPRQSKGG